MNMIRIGKVMLVLSLLIVAPSISTAAAVEALFDLSSPARSPFPSNRFTEFEFRNLTNVRVNLPLPDCAAQVTDCQDVAVINTLDGFNLQPRLSIPFSGAINPASVNSSNVFLVSLGDTTHPFKGFGTVVGINQVVWDPASLTLFAESDQFLDQHTTYALIVTDGILDGTGKRVKAGDFKSFQHALDFRHHRDSALHIYRASLLEALIAARVPRDRIVAASVFTTQSATADLEKINDRIKYTHPAPANFALGNDGSRTIFPLASVSSVVLATQTGTAPTFRTNIVPIAALGIIPGAVGTIAFGSYLSPDYETAGKFIPPVHTRTGVPAIQGINNIYFNLFLPAGPRPASGWPVAIFGHGFGDSKQGAVLTVAASMAARGIATIAINVVGHGGGALGTLTVNRSSAAPVILPSGGRGIDQNGDGNIDITEGSSATVPQGIISSRDGLRQTVIDLMQLVRVIETGGVDVTGSGGYDLDRHRIFYFGQSFGGIYGTIFLGVEPGLAAGVPNVAGGPIIDVSRLGQFRPLVGQALAARVPSLLNVASFTPPLFGFNENLPLRDQPVVTNMIAGAIPIQVVIEQSEWVSQSGNPVAYAPHIVTDPLHGMEPKPVILQFGKGDQTVPNPTNSNIIRAGGLEQRTTFYRNDLAFAANPATPKNPHTFLTGIGSPVTAPTALAAQAQIAVFFQSNGATTIDPDGAGPLFETPIHLPLPEDLSFIP